MHLPHGYSLELDPDVVGSFEREATSIANLGHIHITRGRELYALVMKDGAPVAAVWTELLFAKTFSFDLAVLKEHRRLGIGTFLAKLALSIQRDLATECDVDLDVAVVSDDCERILSRLGLVVANRHAGVTSMTRAKVVAA